MSWTQAEQATLDGFAAIKQHKRHGVAAANKPVTLLWALERVTRGEPRLIPFAEAEVELRPRLNAWGTPGTAASYAFCRLQNDGLWEIASAAELPPRSGDKEPLITALRAHASGGFTEAVHAQLAASPALRVEATLMMGGLLGLQPRWEKPRKRTMEWETTRRAARYAWFRSAVVAAYGPRCVVCEWRLGARGRVLALEAAHVRSRSKEGPDAVDNGVPLCGFHHPLFDEGMFSWDADRRLLVSPLWRDELRGGMPSLHEVAGKALPDPLPGAPRVNDRHLAWHRAHVFMS